MLYTIIKYVDATWYLAVYLLLLMLQNDLGTSRLKLVLFQVIVVIIGRASPCGINSEICLLACLLSRYIIPYIAKNCLSGNQHY